MPREQVLEKLGEPLVAGEFNGSDLMIYAYPGEWRVGSRYLWTGSGTRFFVELQAGVLAAAYFADTSPLGGRLCACTRTSCQPGWANACLGSLPP